MSGPSMEIVYSPACAFNGAFLGMLREMASRHRVDVLEVPFPEVTGALRSWYEEAGILDELGLRRTVFLDVFVDGELVDSVPPDLRVIARALGIETADPPALAAAPVEEHAIDVSQELNEGRILAATISGETCLQEMTLCVDRHPGGPVPRRFRDQCLRMKRPVFAEALEKQQIAGLFLERDGEVLGLIEVLPRETLRRYGFMTGREGNDTSHATIGCYEVACGMPRQQVLDALMSSLLDLTHLLDRPHLEGIGKIGSSDGFNPHWVYEKHGFAPTEELRPGWHVMTRRLRS